MTAWEAWQHAQQGAMIRRGSWYYAGNQMWHGSWGVHRVPWQWGVEDLAAENWEVVDDPREMAMVGFPSALPPQGWTLAGGNDLHLLYQHDSEYRGAVVAEED